MTQDILLEDNYELKILNGDFFIGESEQQETNLILNLFPGNLFEYPACGVGVLNFLAGSEDVAFIKQLIVSQMKKDGFSLDSVDISGSSLNDIKINILANR